MGSTSAPPIAERATRGRTAPGRLSALDAWVCQREAGLLSADLPSHAAFLDLGFGEHPWTTLESAAALRRHCPTLRVVGVEQSPHRVEAASAHADEQTHFLLGSWRELAGLAPARLVRAMNVLRTYPEQDAAAAHGALTAPLMEGGLAIEGTSDERGAVGVAHLLRRRGDGFQREALLFFTDFSRGFAPLLFRDWLPRDLRRRVRPGEPIFALFAAWTAAWEQARRGLSTEPRAAFAASLLGLAERLEGIDRSPWALAHGYLCYAPPGGVPRGLGTPAP